MTSSPQILAQQGLPSHSCPRSVEGTGGCSPHSGVRAGRAATTRELLIVTADGENAHWWPVSFLFILLARACHKAASNFKWLRMYCPTIGEGEEDCVWEVLMTTTGAEAGSAKKCSTFYRYRLQDSEQPCQKPSPSSHSRRHWAQKDLGPQVTGTWKNSIVCRAQVGRSQRLSSSHLPWGFPVPQASLRLQKKWTTYIFKRQIF